MTCPSSTQTGTHKTQHHLITAATVATYQRLANKCSNLHSEILEKKLKPVRPAGRFSNGPLFTEYMADNLNKSLLDFGAAGATSGAVFSTFTYIPDNATNATADGISLPSPDLAQQVIAIAITRSCSRQAELVCTRPKPLAMAEQLASCCLDCSETTWLPLIPFYGRSCNYL